MYNIKFRDMLYLSNYVLWLLLMNTTLMHSFLLSMWTSHYYQFYGRNSYKAKCLIYLTYLIAYYSDLVAWFLKTPAAGSTRLMIMAKTWSMWSTLDGRFCSWCGHPKNAGKLVREEAGDGPPCIAISWPNAISVLRFLCRLMTLMRTRS